MKEMEEEREDLDALFAELDANLTASQAVSVGAGMHPL